MQRVNFDMNLVGGVAGEMFCAQLGLAGRSTSAANAEELGGLIHRVNVQAEQYDLAVAVFKPKRRMLTKRTRPPIVLRLVPLDQLDQLNGTYRVDGRRYRLAALELPSKIVDQQTTVIANAAERSRAERLSP